MHRRTLMVNPKDVAICSAAPESDDLCSGEDQLALACNIELECQLVGEPFETHQIEEIDASWQLVKSSGGLKVRRKICRCRSWIRERWRDLTSGQGHLTLTSYRKN